MASCNAAASGPDATVPKALRLLCEYPPTRLGLLDEAVIDSLLCHQIVVRAHHLEPNDPLGAYALPPQTTKDTEPSVPFVMREDFCRRQSALKNVYRDALAQRKTLQPLFSSAALKWASTTLFASSSMENDCPFDRCNVIT